MPDFPQAPQEGVRPRAQNDVLDKFAQEANDFKAQKALLNFDSKACMRCHPQKDNSGFKLDLTPLDFGRFEGKAGRDPLLVKFLEARKETDEERAQRRAREFEKFKPHEKAISVFAALPEKARIEIGKDKLSVQTNFAQALEAIPGVKLDPVAKDVLASIKSLSLQNDKFEAQFNGEKKLPLGVEIPLLGKANELRLSDKEGKLKFDLDMDPKDTKQVGLKNITGLALVLEGGKELGIRGLKLDATGEKAMLKVTIDNPKEKPEKIPEALWPKTITLPVPLDKVAPGMSSEFVSGLLKTCSDMRSVLKNRDFSVFLSAIPEDGLRNTAGKLLSGVSKIEKNGNEISIVRDNGMLTHDLGGATMKVSPYVKFKLGSDPLAPRIENLSGVFVEVPVPSELGLGDKMTASIRSLDLSRADGAGNRDLTLSTDSILERLNVRVNSEMQPVKDGAGNWYANIRVPNVLSNRSGDKLNCSLRFGSDGNLNMKPSEILDIVSKASGQAVDLSFSGAGNAVIHVGTKIVSGIADFFGW